MKRVGELFEELVDIIATIRKKCPWDRQQTNETIRINTLEEAYEVVEAIDEKDDNKIEEELGDLLMQVVLNAQIAMDENRFDISGVIRRINEKLIRRHPHVFADVKVKDAQDVLKNWEEIKRQEKKSQTSILDGVPTSFPSLMKAYKIQSKASKVGFDWESVHDVLLKVYEELDELKESIELNDQRRIEEEIGDLLFSIVNVSRFLGVNPELALSRTNAKFIKRFKQMERIISERGDDIKNYKLSEMDQIWESIKGEES